jgi:enoyl-CoA hydratase
MIVDDHDPRSARSLAPGRHVTRVALRGPFRQSKIARPVIESIPFSAMIDLSREDEVAILRLSHAPVNALDLEFMQAVVGGLDQVESSDARALVVTGDGPAFSAGADLFRVIGGDPDYMGEAGAAMSRLFERLFTFPKPTVAAVNGHAIAGGCVLVCACDYRVSAAGDHRIGFSELAVGVPFPSWALEILRFAVGAQHVRDLALIARTMNPEEALAKGMVDEIVGSAELMERAVKAARRLARIPRETFELTKRALIAPAVERVAAYGPEHDKEVARVWATDDVQAAIREFLDRTVGKAKRS